MPHASSTLQACRSPSSPPTLPIAPRAGSVDRASSRCPASAIRRPTGCSSAKPPGQIELIAPRIIVALGKSAATLLLGEESSIASLRGRVHRYRDVPLIVTYHPAYLLRSLPDKAKAWEDLLLAKRVVAGA